LETMSTTNINDLTESAIGCILGTAVGDALGLPCEGLSSRRQGRWFPSLDKYHLIMGKGLCSDDTEHTCMITQSIVVSGGDEQTFARDFAWRLRWWLAGLPAGIGWGTLRSILKLWLFLPEKYQGVYSAGNGPAMRSAILGVCFAEDEKRLKQFVRISTRLTHVDPKAECGALAIALAARSSMRHQSFNEFIEDLARLTRQHLQAGHELQELVINIRESVNIGESTEHFVKKLDCQKGVTGYVYHSVPAVLHAWQSYPDDFPRSLQTIIRCGGDTDTTAAMLGAIIGAGVGKQGIPKQWLDDLIEWPRTVAWMENLAIKAVTAVQNKKPGKAHSLSITGLAVRNMGFLLLVLMHGFRRLLPPY
jgi:ADP-ribosyl-[dinitrogen reductase] hydrolase